MVRNSLMYVHPMYIHRIFHTLAAQSTREINETQLHLWGMCSRCAYWIITRQRGSARPGHVVKALLAHNGKKQFSRVCRLMKPFDRPKQIWHNQLHLRVLATCQMLYNWLSDFVIQPYGDFVDIRVWSFFPFLYVIYNLKSAGRFSCMITQTMPWCPLGVTVTTNLIRGLTNSKIPQLLITNTNSVTHFTSSKKRRTNITKMTSKQDKRISFN